jgi:dTDP-glucose 4,6-dehydratase
VLRNGSAGETYNVGSGVEATIEEIADRVLELTGRPSSLKAIVPDRPGHDRRYLLDATKISEELGWKPSRAFDDGLAETVSWYEANRGWWEPLKRRAPVEEGAWK